MNEQLIERIRLCPNLPTLPAIAVQVLGLASREDVDIIEIARLISKDPALSSKILRTVNSSFYGRSQHVSTISQALVILGLQSVKTLVLGFSLVPSIGKHATAGFKRVQYWKRSIYAATAARSITIKLNIVQQEEAFLAALLMDIGMLVLDQVLGPQYGEICARCPSHAELLTAEAQTLGMTHAEVGHVMAEQWKLPPILAVPIGFHHSTDQITDTQLRRITEVMELAGQCADIFVDDPPARAISAARQTFAEKFNVPQEESDALLDEIGKRTREVASLFEINIGSPMEYDAILKKANETLVEITLQSQQHATQLQEQNEKLKEAATTDALTGLANRPTFDKFLAEKFADSRVSGRPLSLLMVDVDRFKRVNDTMGHPAGDAVLRALGQLFRSAARPQDLAARYGGEELVLILPGTNRVTAAAIAEILRRALADRPIPYEGTILRVTASVGVATCEGDSPFTQPAQLVKAADLAVYNAKHAGRNCVKVFTFKPTAQRATTAA